MNSKFISLNFCKLDVLVLTTKNRKTTTYKKLSSLLWHFLRPPSKLEKALNFTKLLQSTDCNCRLDIGGFFQNKVIQLVRLQQAAFPDLNNRRCVC